MTQISTMTQKATLPAIGARVPVVIDGDATNYNFDLGACLSPLLHPDGTQLTVTTTGGATAAKVGQNMLVTSTATTGQYSVRFAALVKNGNLSDGTNDIADTLISRWQNISNGSTWGRWDVFSSPLNPASGLPTAPGGAQSFAAILGEGNPQNRYGDPTWEGEARALNNWVGGYQMVAETQDFSTLLGTGIRRGYKVSFAYLISRSAFTNDDQQRHALFNVGVLYNPNTIAAGGAGIFATGYKQFVTAIAISAAGSGYTAGDQLTLNTGLSAATNQNAVVRVKTVNGSGAITAAEVLVSGWYSAGFASPIGVTGGTGTGATFTYTLSTNTAERPQAFAGISGEWKYGIDGCFPNGTNSNLGYGVFGAAMMRAPNNTQIVVARNAADNADVNFNKLNSSNEWVVSQSGSVVRFQDNITAFPPASATPVSNGEMTFQLTNNTTLVIKVKGSDGTVRSTTLTLA